MVAHTVVIFHLFGCKSGRPGEVNGTVYLFGALHLSAIYAVWGASYPGGAYLRGYAMVSTCNILVRK